MCIQLGLLLDALQHPADDTPRLVLADWLDEHGEAEQAGLIRARLNVARLLWGDTPRPDSPGPERVVRAVAGALGRLPEEARVVIVLRDLLGTPADRIVGQLGLTEGSVARLLLHGRHRLRELLRWVAGDSGVVGTAEPATPPGRDGLLHEAVLAYLRAVDAGVRPDRQEVRARHPDLAPALAAFFDDEEHLGPLLDPLRDAGLAAPVPAGWGRPFGDYELLWEVGRGDLGVVYKARQVSRGRTVALKMVLADEYAGPQQLARFRAEAAPTPRHPHIVQVFDVGQHEGHLYLAGEYCPGGSLADHLGGTPPPPREAARLVETLARAMHTAHGAGVLHHDLKPANVLFAEDGRPKVADFGLARWGRRVVRICGAIIGTPDYMAPEQVTGRWEEVGPAVDVYGLGAILYKLLTGRPPFRGANGMDTLLQVATESPVRPSRLNPRVPSDLETICLKCLQKQPGRRYASALELAEDLGRFQAGGPASPQPEGVVGRVLGWVQRRRGLARWLAGG